MTTRSLVRGCGTRQPGAAYLVCGLSEAGIPVEDLVVDAPIAVDPTGLGVAAVGMTIAKLDTGPVLLDWVGSEHYAQPADFVEEVALFGSSRRVPTTFDFAQLGPGVEHLLLHARAGLADPTWPLERRPRTLFPVRPSFLSRARQRTRRECPFKGEHPAGEMCACLWWENLLPETVAHASLVDHFEAQVRREQPVSRRMPSFEYRGFCLPDADVWAPVWRPAVFLRLPVTRVEVVRDPGDLGHEVTLSRAERARIPVVEVDA